MTSYPAPIEDGMLYFEVDNNNMIKKIIVFELLGRKNLEDTNIVDQINLIELQKKETISYLLFQIQEVTPKQQL